MRFACQSCGKAYNLPEERIAEKSNVKLKCRVCGAIVEVKKQGELVAHLLDETEEKRMTRVSEAPAPLTSISPDDDDDPDGATVSISESSLNDRGPLEIAIPGAAPTGFSPAAASALSSSAFSSSVLSSSGGFGASAAAESALLTQGALLAAGEGVERRDAPNVAPPLPPPPLSPSSLPPPPALRADVALEPLMNGSASNGAGASNGSAAFFGEAVSADVDESLTPELRAPVAPAVLGNGMGGNGMGGNGIGGGMGASSLGGISGGALLGGAVSTNQLGASAISSDLADFPAPEGAVAGKDPLFKIKMLAAFATGVLIDRIVSGLFQ